MLLSSLSLWHIVVPTKICGSMSEGQWVGWMIDKDEGMSHQWPGNQLGCSESQLKPPSGEVSICFVEQEFDPLCHRSPVLGFPISHHITPLFFHRNSTWNFPGAVVRGPGFGLLAVRWILWLPLHFFLFAVPCVQHWKLQVLWEPALLVAKLPGLPGQNGRGMVGWSDGDSMKFLSW